MTIYDYLIVGAGFSGLTCARKLADEGNRVLVIDKRDHIGGNAYDKLDERGILIHPYGPHIFHTNSKRIIEFLSKFTDWRFYEHRVLAKVASQYYPIPINRQTINKVFGLQLSESEAETFLNTQKINKSPIKNSEDLVLSSVGNKLCDMFFRGYTKKQWNLDLSELSAGVAARIPTRVNDDDRYFTDQYQFMPSHGYTAMFEKMIQSENIEVSLGVDFLANKPEFSYKKLIFTGPIDSYYGHKFGKLPYRSLRFEHEHFDNCNLYQSVGTINFPNEQLFTRITEFKHLTGQKQDGTSIVREYSQAEGDPYYPMPNSQNEIIYKKYQSLADNEEAVYFVGRLAQYRYYNMDQVVASALSLCEKIT